MSDPSKGNPYTGNATTGKSKLEISLLLPEVAHAGDNCVERLQASLEAKEGVEVAHAVDIEGSPLGQICIHFDPDRLSIGEVRELARRTGAELERRYGHLLLKARPTYASRASAIEARLARTPGVLEAVVSPDGEIRVEYDREQTDEAKIQKALSSWVAESAPQGQLRDQVHDDRASGTSPSEHGHDDHDETEHEHSGCCHSGHNRDGVFGEKTELVFACLAGVFLLAGWLAGKFTLLPSWAAWAPLALLVASYFFGGFYTVKEMIEKLRAGKFEIDFLMLVAAAGAASLGAWAEGALLLFLFSLGHSLEGYAMGRAKQAIESLAELAPRTARVRRDGQETEVPVEELLVGDVVVVKPDERVAADGFVIAGESSVDQAPITGESVPVDKLPVAEVAAAAADPEAVSAESRVYAGTINQAGALEVQVTKLASENTLARVVKLVNEAETRVSPTQRFTKKFERYFVPTVLAGVVLLLFAPLVIDEPFSKSFYRAMAVLVAASPCALAIATPSAVLSGVGRAARGGVLVKGGAPLESLGRLDSIAFDKTGTLTEGKPKVTDICPVDDVSEAELLRIAIAVEDLSKHPLAQAVVRDGKSRLKELDIEEASLPEAIDLRSITGRGLEATVEGETIHIGKDALFAELEGTPLPEEVLHSAKSLEQAGRTTMIVRRGDKYLGVLGLMDTPREASKRTIKKLRELGIHRIIMISGDNQQVASAIAQEVGLDEARGDLMPADKVAEIKKLASEAGVAMVGDGVNDAPAMASATVGIAMGAAGSDVALETADVALMADNLDHLPLAIGLSRATSRIIRQNLWMSLGMVAFLVPATIMGLDLGPAVILHEGSTLVVVFNALRLLAYRE